MKDTGNLQYEYESLSSHVDTSIQEVLYYLLSLLKKDKKIKLLNNSANPRRALPA